MRTILFVFLTALSLTSCASDNGTYQRILAGTGTMNGVIRQTDDKAFFEYSPGNEIIAYIDNDQTYRGFATLENTTIYTIGVDFKPNESSLADMMTHSLLSSGKVPWQGIATLYGATNDNLMMCNLSPKKGRTLTEGGIAVCQTLDGRVLDVIINKAF